MITHPIDSWRHGRCSGVACDNDCGALADVVCEWRITGAYLFLCLDCSTPEG